jgi:hypothetical protein
MRRAVGFLSTVVVPVFVATMAFAADPYGAAPGSESEPGAGHSHGQAATSGTSGYMGEHSMTGKITDIDKEKGRVKVDAQGEKLDLHFPQSALRNLNEGDQVTVTLGIKPATGSGTSGSRGGTSGTSGSGTSGTGGMPGSSGSGSRY